MEADLRLERWSKKCRDGSAQVVFESLVASWMNRMDWIGKKPLKTGSERWGAGVCLVEYVPSGGKLAGKVHPYNRDGVCLVKKNPINCIMQCDKISSRLSSSLLRWIFMDKLPVRAISIVCLETVEFINQVRTPLTGCFVICSNDALHGPSWDDVMLFT